VDVTHEQARWAQQVLAYVLGEPVAEPQTACASLADASSLVIGCGFTAADVNRAWPETEMP
jgi:hypothetical protein